MERSPFEFLRTLCVYIRRLSHPESCNSPAWLLRGQPWAMPAYVTAAVLTLYTHSVGIFVLLALMLFVAGLPMIAPTERWRRALVGSCS